MVDLTNELVEHPVYGTGRVIIQDNRRITIQFSEETEQKRFIYPDAFDNCLNMCNPAAAQKVLADLIAKTKQIEEMQRKEEEAAQKTWGNVVLATPRRKFAVKTKQPQAKTKAAAKKK